METQHTKIYEMQKSSSKGICLIAINTYIKKKDLRQQPNITFPRIQEKEETTQSQQKKENNKYQSRNQDNRKDQQNLRFGFFTR